MTVQSFVIAKSYCTDIIHGKLLLYNIELGIVWKLGRTASALTEAQHRSASLAFSCFYGSL